MMATKHLQLMTALMTISSAAAQTTVDIRVAENVNDSLLEIYLRPTTDFGEFVASLTFTLQWPMSAGDTLGNRTLTCPDALLVSATTIVSDPPYLQRTYTSFNTELLMEWACGWNACEERLIMTVPVDADFAFGPFGIVPATYSISLNGGINNTGIVYTTEPCLSTGINMSTEHDRTGLRVIPSPASTEVYLLLPPGTPVPPYVDVIGADGRRSHLACLPNGGCDIHTLPAGAYVVSTEDLLGRFVKL